MLLFRVLLVILDELWHNLFHSAVDDVVSNLVDRSLWVRIDGDDDARVFHACHVLDGARYAAGNVYLWTHSSTSLANLAVVVNPSRIDSGAACAHLCVKFLGKLEANS